MNYAMWEVLSLFAFCNRTFSQFRRAQVAFGISMSAATAGRLLAEAVSRGYLFDSGDGEFSLTDLGAASLGESATPGASITKRTRSRIARTVLKVNPVSSPILSRQGFDRELIFGEHNIGDASIALERVHLKTGEESTPHVHLDTETVVYTIAGIVRLYYGSELENVVEVNPTECVYIPPNVPHYVVNEYPEPMIAVVARSSSRNEVIEYPNLRDRLPAASIS